MKIEVINNRQKKNKILKYSFCVGAAIVGTLGFSNINVKAASEGSGTVGDDNFSLDNAQNNALQGMGFTDFNTVKNHVDFYTPDGKPATPEYIAEVSQKGSMEDYLVVKYKDDPTSQKLGQIFGSNGAAMQQYLDTQGGNYTQHLDQLIDIQKQMAQLSGTIVNEKGQAIMTIDPITGKATFVEGVDFSKVVNNGDADKLQQLAELWRELTGNDDILSLSPEDLEILISKMDRLEDVNVKLTPNKRTYYAITKVRFTITNKNSGSPASNVSVDNVTTAQLFSQYNSKWANKFRSITGQSVPTLTKVGNGVFEMDFKTPIMSTSNKWKKIIQGWTTNASASDFLGTGAFTITPSSEPLKVKVDVIGDQYIYYEKIVSGAYPAGNNGSTSDNPTNYTFANYKNSYYYANYDSDVNRSTGRITQSWGKVPNHNIRAKQQTAYNNVLKWEYRIDWSEFPYKYIRDEYGNKKKFYYWERVPYYFYTKEIYDNGAKYRSSEQNQNNNQIAGDRPLYSVDDGSYVRDIWIRTQYVRYWDFKDEPLTGSEAYGDTPYVVSKFNHSSVKGFHPLVRFDGGDDAQRRGYIKVKEKSGDWDAPKVINADRLMSSTTWNLAPLDGKIQIPVRTQTGQMEGVINGADMNIR